MKCLLAVYFLGFSALSQEAHGEESLIYTKKMDNMSITDRLDGLPRGEVLQYFRQQAEGSDGCLGMKSWLEEQGFVVVEYKGLEAGFPDNEDAIRLLATFSEPPQEISNANSAVGKLLELVLRHVGQWNFADDSTGLTAVYSNCDSIPEISVNPKGI